jgi:uroporphyrinogen decarboxylase
MLSPEMYDLFGYPVLKAVFERYSPLPEHERYQHSDSEMGHLLPALGRLNMTGVNFGPGVLVPEIRRYLPNARIDGCIAPFTFSRNDREGLIRQTKRDCLDGLKYGGVNIATAGSINYGSSLDSLRLIMATIQQYGRA